MASSEDFRQQLKAGKVQEAFAGALAEAVQLKITTWVAADAEDGAQTAAQPGYRLRTQINTIEGAIANEIGDQFIGNGPYRDLLPFHLDQVAQGNQLVENNLKSLQKLFEILIALQYHKTGLSEIEYPPLSIPPQETATPPDAGVAAELTAQTPDLTTPDIQEQVSPESTPSPEITTAPSPEITTAWEEDEEDEDDEDDSVLDLLESLPPPPPPPLEDEEFSITEEDARDEFIEAEPEPLSDRHEAELDEDDWQVLNEDWGTLKLEELKSPPSAEPDIPPQTDIEPKPREPESAKKMPSLDSLEELNQDTDDDTDWDDWVVDEPELGDRSFAQMDTDEDWGDLVEDFDPFAAPPPVEESPSALNIQEDWDEFAVEELEPYSDLTEVDSEIEWSDLSESQTPESTSDPLEGLDALAEDSEEKELNSESSSDPMDLLGDQNQSAENVDQQDYEFEELSLDEFSLDDFDPLSHPQEEDLEKKPKSTQKGEPPPPPPPSPFQDKKQEP
ncbi:hypothetical protein [Coleofasciculus sp. F4-SAH-05]|uniref:hypothetical protein n=1 Tax=Coleofasciculus sp. F4-SAH-05 TaxID=3069525 RepID=UPI0033054211